jgi:hypothetical protein
MREIEIRRHSCTKKGLGRGRGSHLSRDGVLLAREVAAGMGTFDTILATEVPRTTETALAMGFAVDDLLACPLEIASAAFDVLGHQERWGWTDPWARFAELVASNSAVSRLGEWHRDAWTSALDRLPDSGRLLVISHGRLIESGVVACLAGLNQASLTRWGSPLHHCEGIRMTYRNGAFRDPVILRARPCAGALRGA